MNFNIKLTPPVSEHDPRVLGAGSSKFAWKSKYLNDAVINSFDFQRINQKPYGMTMVDWNIKYDDNMRKEYEFTKYVRTIFGDLIPWVEYIPCYRFYDTKFRYEKQLCDKVEMNTLENRVQFFHEMFEIQDILLSKGWVFLDMKPDNVGLRKESLSRSLCLIDTDPCHFYRVPPDMIEHFRVAGYIIILLVSINLLMPNDVMIQKMKEKGLTSEKVENTYQYFQTVDMNNITVYGNTFLKSQSFKVADLQNPLVFINHYGSGQRFMMLLALALQLELHVKQPASVSLNSPVRSFKLDESNSSNRSGTASLNNFRYSINSILNSLNTGSPVYDPRTPRNLARNGNVSKTRNLKKSAVNIIKERVLERKRLNQLSKETTKHKSPAKRKTTKNTKI